METGILTPKKLFQKDIHYKIPAFQRQYVWTQEDQWGPLWDDVRNTAESYLERLDSSASNYAKAEEDTLPHFLGAVVVQQVHTATKDIEQREVIDGQQRITTLQLLLDAVQLVVCEERALRPEPEVKRLSKRLSKLVTNDEDLVTDENPNLKFKLLPTTSDIEAFKHAMDNGLATDEFEDSLIVQAHEFFQLQTREWLNTDREDPRRIGALETAVAGLLQMVVIDLEPNDDPHVIFETLNARGTPLLESDLIKNYVMSKVSQAKTSEIWGDLDDEWWKKKIRQGRLYRPRIDMLLNYWLAMRIRTEVSPSTVFREFKSLTEDLSVEEAMLDVKRDLGNYRNFEEPAEEPGKRDSPEEDIFHYRTRVMQMGVITPALLLLLSVPTEKRIKSLQALESFLVRRMICRGSTKDYNRLILGLADKFQKNGLDNADSIIVNFLREQTADSRKWPNDEDLERALITLPLYWLLTKGRLRLVLEGIEGRFRTQSMVEQSGVPRNLTIEHVMPQSWEANWPLPEGVEKLEGTNDRNRFIHTIGNLTLVTRRLNPSLSNAPWEDKRRTLADHSVLFLNKELLNESQDTEWDEQCIQSRSKRMAELVTEVWPGPRSAVWNS